MPITVKHLKVSTIPDAGDDTLVEPSDWNADHTLTGLGTMAEQNANAVAITGGTISGVTIPASNVTGTLGVPNGGTGATTLTGYVKGTGTAALTGSATIPNTDITGLGTASTKDAGAALGVATLDSSGKVPISELPAAVLGALSYQGTWDASTNTPTLASSVGTKGYYYVVSVAGSTNLNGITDWLVGDWAVYNGSAWQKVDNTDAVTSVNTLTGAVVLTTTNIAEGTNLYYTDARARGAISAGTGISYVSGTGVITNSLPDQVVALTGAGTTVVTGTYPNFTVTSNDAYVGTVTSVSGTAPVSVATGTTTPVISLDSGYGDTQNPYASKTANYVLASPNGSAGVPTFRALTATDIPSLTGVYIPYTGATTAVDLNAKTATNISRLGINSTAVPEILLRAYGDNNSSSRIAIRGYSSDANSSAIRIAKFRGTFAGPQAPQSGDSLGKFELAGYGTTSSTGYPQATYEGLATENWGATARGAKVVFKVTPNTTTTQVTALTINQDSTAVFANTVTANGVLLTGNTGTVTSVTGTAPVVSSGGNTPAISMAAATTSVDGYLTATDWTTFNAKQAALVSGTNIKTINTNSILGSGDLTIAATPAGSDTQIQYNNSGALGASASLTFASNTLTAPNLVASNGLVMNNGTVGASFAIASGYNAMSVGPVTVASGQSVTVPSGSRWVVL
jgi:hypothetical protein